MKTFTLENLWAILGAFFLVALGICGALFYTIDLGPFFALWHTHPYLIGNIIFIVSGCIWVWYFQRNIPINASSESGYDNGGYSLDLHYGIKKRVRFILALMIVYSLSVFLSRL